MSWEKKGRSQSKISNKEQNYNGREYIIDQSRTNIPLYYTILRYNLSLYVIKITIIIVDMTF